MNQDVLEQVLGCQTLPTLPAVAVQVLELTENPDVSLTELARVIQNDQGLSAKILRTVNSSFYGMRHKCATIQQAMAMLGLSTVKSLALGFSLVTCLSEHQAEGFDYIAYWRRQLFAAVGAREAAHRAMPRFENEAFLGGLFQDIGMVAMYVALGPAYGDVLRACGPSHRALVKHELASFEVQHPDVGALIASRWKLPQTLVAPIKYHERPTAAPPEWAPIVRCVAFGGLLHNLVTDEDPVPAMDDLRARAAEWLDIPGSEIDAIVDSVATSTRQLASTLRLDTGPAPDTQAILAKARDRAAIVCAKANANPDDDRLDNLVADSHTHDPLTGTLQRAAFDALFEGLFRQATASGNPLALVLVHVDGFSQRTSEFGAPRADDVLAAVSTILLERLEPLGASVARWGRDTFAFSIAGVNVRRMGDIISDVRRDLGQSHLSWNDPGSLTANIPVTLSIGSATLDATTRSVLCREQQVVAAAMQAVAACRDAGGNGYRAFARLAA